MNPASPHITSAIQAPPEAGQTILRLVERVVRSGLASIDQVNEALRLKAEQGGALALHLVLQGAVEEEALANFYARQFEMARADARLISSVSAAVFQLIPIEIVYDNGILPLALMDEDRLLVGVVDPSEPERLEEAAFFAGYALEPTILRVRDMAEAFARLSGQPWKVSVEELDARRALREAPELDSAVLDGLFDELSTVEPLLEQEMSGDGDVRKRLLLHVEALSSGDYEAAYELTPEHRKNIAPLEPGGMPPPPVAEEAPSVILSKSLLRIEVPQQSRLAARLARTEHTSASLEATPVIAQEAALHPANLPDSGEVVPPVNAFLDAIGPPSAAAVAPPLRTRTAFRTPTGETHPLEWATAGTAEVRPEDGVFSPPAQLFERMPPAGVVTRAAFRHAMRGIERAETRDDIARELVQCLGLAIPNVILLSLRLPRVVIWDAQMRRGPARLPGRLLDLQEGGVLHRAARESLGFRGRLPDGDPLRDALGRELGRDSLVLPLTVKRRVIGFLVLDAGYEDELPPMQDQYVALSESLGEAFRRVILLRKSTVRAG